VHFLLPLHVYSNTRLDHYESLQVSDDINDMPWLRPSTSYHFTFEEDHQWRDIHILPPLIQTKELPLWYGTVSCYVH
jgi:hypothetical protein